VEDGVDKEGKKQYKTITVENIINNTNPLWAKAPANLKDEDYLAFYKELYPFSEDPLFWIHLNVDYPFNLTGILYFPKVKNDFELHKNKIHLYSRQVFITDEVKSVVPDFLMLLHGVIDSPDIPLNVSRSYLQSDASVKKISQHISKKTVQILKRSGTTLTSLLNTESSAMKSFTNAPGILLCLRMWTSSISRWKNTKKK
jgi:molecular chaperone HtpG